MEREKVIPNGVEDFKRLMLSKPLKADLDLFAFKCIQKEKTLLSTAHLMFA